MLRRISLSHVLIASAVAFSWTCLFPVVVVATQAAASDSDGDGLSDFHEQHKYLTDPENSDSDGDGIPDGDWRERREYQYTIRSVVHVMKPVTVGYLDDDFQDARVLDESDEYVELEVIHYPFNTIESTITPDNDWRENVKSLSYWLEPGRSADCSPELTEKILAALKTDGIDISEMTDVEVVNSVSQWLCDRAEYQDGFTGFITAWDDEGNRYMPSMFSENIERELKKTELTLQEQWEREVSASGMFENKKRGSCTSSAIYLNGCMRAVGIPTRTVLCIPVIDAGDEREMELVRGIKHPGVRQHLLLSLRPLQDSWSSHTFNEVFVGGRWYRLNYSTLGQGIYDRQLFGLITHVATFHDWADAEMYKTVGKRQKSDRPRDIFGFANPYSTIALRDVYGEHCTIEMPGVEEDRIVVEEIFWTDDEALPQDIIDNCQRRGRFGFIARCSGVRGMPEFQDFLERADLRVLLIPAEDEHPELKVGFEPGCFWIMNNHAYIYVPFGGGDREGLAMDVEYEFRPRNQQEGRGWILNEELKAVRKKALPGT